jgi:hypothetical protein
MLDDNLQVARRAQAQHDANAQDVAHGAAVQHI